MTIDATNEECFTSGIAVFDLYYYLYCHECCLKKLALEKLKRTEQLPDCEANSNVISKRQIHDITLQSKDPLILRISKWTVSALKEL